MDSPASDSAILSQVCPVLSPRHWDRICPGTNPLERPLTTLTDEELERLQSEVTRWLLWHPRHEFGTTLPTLWQLRHDPIELIGFPEVVTHKLTRFAVLSWGDLAEWTPEQLAHISGGEAVLERFLNELVWVALTAATQLAPPPVRTPRQRIPDERGRSRKLVRRAVVENLSHLCDWAVAEGDATTLADLFRIVQTLPKPDEISEAVDDLMQAPLAELFPGRPPIRPVPVLLEDLLQTLDARRRQVFTRRTDPVAPATLEQIGQDLGITRERVRQLEAEAFEQLRANMLAPRFTPLMWRLDALRATLGLGMPEEQSRPVLQRLQANSLLLWFAGPYRLQSNGWLTRGPLPDASRVRPHLNADGHVNWAELTHALVDAGLSQSVHAAWSAQFAPIKAFGDVLVDWSGSILDKAERVLKLWKRPATIEEILATVGEDYEVRSVRNRILCDDARFVRTDKLRVGLLEWGLPSYTSTADEIAEEIDRLGGLADKRAIIDALMTRFGVREATVIQYFQAPMFINDGNTIRRRTPDDPPLRTWPLDRATDCTPRGEAIVAWRFKVNTDALRGSGRPVPPALAQWLGVTPGESVSYAAESDSIRIQWPWTALAPSMGSLRVLLAAHNAQPGDTARLEFNRQTLSVTLTLQSESQTEPALDESP